MVMVMVRVRVRVSVEVKVGVMVMVRARSVSGDPSRSYVASLGFLPPTPRRKASHLKEISQHRWTRGVSSSTKAGSGRSRRPSTHRPFQKRHEKEARGVPGIGVAHSSVSRDRNRGRGGIMERDGGAGQMRVVEDRRGEGFEDVVALILGVVGVVLAHEDVISRGDVARDLPGTPGETRTGECKESRDLHVDQGG